MSITKISFTVILLGLLLSFNSSAQNVDTSLVVNGVCGMCKLNIETAVEELKGVNKVSWDVESKILSLNYDDSVVTLEQINKAVNLAGYDTEYSTANEEAYEKLHGCCKYRDPEVVKSHQ